MSVKKEYDIGLVVPLKEEFQYVADMAAVIGRHAYDGTFFYEMDFDGGSKSLVLSVKWGRFLLRTLRTVSCLLPM